MIDGFQICKEIASLNDSISGVEIAEKGTTVAAYYARPADMSKIERLLIHMEIYIDILQANQEQLGRPHYIMTHSDRVDLFFYPITINGRQMILVIKVVVPNEHEQIVSKIREYIGNMHIVSRRDK